MASLVLNACKDCGVSKHRAGPKYYVRYVRYNTWNRLSEIFLSPHALYAAQVFLATTFGKSSRQWQ